MEIAHLPEGWHDMLVVLGTSAAALIGLLFIATSLHLKEVVNNLALQRRAFNNTCYLVVILVETLLVLTPQPPIIVGAELIALNLVGLSLPVRFVANFFTHEEVYRRAGGQLHRAAIFIASFLLGIAGGVAFTQGLLSWGLYLVAASCIIFMVRVVFMAWSIMVSVGQSEPAWNEQREAMHERQ
jgi:hypothetical protein